MKFHFVLLGVVCAHALAQDENREVKATTTSTNVTWNNAVLPTDMKSALFETCITAANTKKLQYFVIVDPEQGIEFVKYEVNRFEKGLRPVNWKIEIKCNDILDCAMASKAYRMFQYNGTTCRMANVTYIDVKGEFWDDLEGYNKDVVYINTAVPPSGCPANTDVLAGKTGPVCLGGTHLDVPFDRSMPSYSCSKHYGGLLYLESDSVNFTTIRNYLRKEKYQGEYLIGASYQEYSEVYTWSDDSLIDTSYFAVKPQEPFFQTCLVISSSHDYLLRVINDTDLITGFLCIGNPIE